jgi:hypothetical protein
MSEAARNLRSERSPLASFFSEISVYCYAQVETSDCPAVNPHRADLSDSATHEPADPVCPCRDCAADRLAAINARLDRWSAERSELLESGVRELGETVRPPRMRVIVTVPETVQVQRQSLLARLQTAFTAFVRTFRETSNV